MAGSAPAGPVSFSLSSTSARRAGPEATNGVKRTHAVALDDESDDEVAHGTETITHFAKSAGGGFNAARPKISKGPLVIAPTANKRWQDARQDGHRNSHQAKAAMPERSTAIAEAQEAEALRNRPKHGLNITKSEHVPDDTADDEGRAAHPETPSEPEHVRTLDEIALDRLRGIQEASTLSVPALTEAEAFARDFKSAPEQASAADYAAVPVEEFGAALLRGMGWKEGMGIGNQKEKKIVESKLAERRAPLLGIGAKQDAAVAAELGTWGHGARRRDREGGGYNPVVLRNRKTGEELTEEEMAARVKAQKERPVKDDDRDRLRRDDREQDDRGYRSSRRERSHERSRRDDRRDDRRHRHDDRHRDRDRDRRDRDRHRDRDDWHR